MLEKLVGEKCCGCGACHQKCPSHAINMVENKDGFLYPVLDKTKCCNCGLCKNVCPVLVDKEERRPINIFAAWNLDDDIRLHSSSGGLFSSISETIIDKGGVVFGVRFDDNWEPVFDYVEQKQDLALFRGSKYVQARVGDAYSKVLFFLRQGRLVLFSGTPCQVAGLKHFLKGGYDNLLTLDFICHGVPSPGIWRWYLKNQRKEARRKFAAMNIFSIFDSLPIIKDVVFRDKENGWQKYRFSISFESQKNKQRFDSSVYFFDNPYMKVFLRDLILRPSCHTCDFKCGRSHSDITIADFWGIDSVLPEIEHAKGISLLMVNTEIGNGCIEQLRGVKKIHVLLNDAIKHNPYWAAVPKPNPRREVFFRHYRNHPTDFALFADGMPLTLTEKFKEKIKSWVHKNGAQRKR